MQTLFTEGGAPMWFLLAFGIGMLVLAARYAMAPTGWALRATIGLGCATGFTSVTGVAADFAAVGHHGFEYMKRTGATLPEMLLQGFAESMAPAILGFTMLSLGAMLVTFGAYREGKA